jgi:hypothetical protein
LGGICSSSPPAVKVVGPRGRRTFLPASFNRYGVAAQGRLLVDAAAGPLVTMSRGNREELVFLRRAPGVDRFDGSHLAAFDRLTVTLTITNCRADQGLLIRSTSEGTGRRPHRSRANCGGDLATGALPAVDLAIRALVAEPCDEAFLIAAFERNMGDDERAVLEDADLVSQHVDTEGRAGVSYWGRCSNRRRRTPCFVDSSTFNQFKTRAIEKCIRPAIRIFGSLGLQWGCWRIPAAAHPGSVYVAA